MAYAYSHFIALPFFAMTEEKRLAYLPKINELLRLLGSRAICPIIKTTSPKNPSFTQQQRDSERIILLWPGRFREIDFIEQVGTIHLEEKPMDIFTVDENLLPARIRCGNATTSIHTYFGVNDLVQRVRKHILHEKIS